MKGISLDYNDITTYAVKFLAGHMGCIRDNKHRNGLIEKNNKADSASLIKATIIEFINHINTWASEEPLDSAKMDEYIKVYNEVNKINEDKNHKDIINKNLDVI